MLEIWFPVKVLSHYSVSNLGRIKNKNGRILKKKITNGGYEAIVLSSDNKDYYCLVHRLVALAIFASDGLALEVNHKDGNKTNNCVWNLEWVTPSQNKSHAYNNKLRVPPNQKCVMIIETGEIFSSYTECAKHINGQQSHVGACLRGEIKHHKGFTFQNVEV